MRHLRPMSALVLVVCGPVRDRVRDVARLRRGALGAAAAGPRRRADPDPDRCHPAGPRADPRPRRRPAGRSRRRAGCRSPCTACTSRPSASRWPHDAPRPSARAPCSSATSRSSASRSTASSGPPRRCSARAPTRMPTPPRTPTSARSASRCPASLPVINRRAVELVIATGIAIEAEIPERTQWERKNYFYPDLPKGYQISQYAIPLAAARPARGSRPRTGPFTVPITRAHLEEDTAKLVHADDGRRRRARGRALVDFNRSRRPADGDRHRARHPDRRAGPPLRRGAPAAAARDRRERRGHGARPDAGRGERLAPAAWHRRRSGRGSRSRT